MKLIEQLQIGDWIRFKNGGEYCKITAVRADSPVTDNFSETIRTNLTDTFYTADCFEPIPISAALLEKNGFVYYGTPLYQFWDGQRIHVDKLGKNEWAVLLPIRQSMKLNGVHDLQHILRMVNGKENIVL